MEAHHGVTVQRQPGRRKNVTARRIARRMARRTTRRASEGGSRTLSNCLLREVKSQCSGQLGKLRTRGPASCCHGEGPNRQHGGGLNTFYVHHLCPYHSTRRRSLFSKRSRVTTPWHRPQWMSAGIKLPPMSALEVLDLEERLRKMNGASNLLGPRQICEALFSVTPPQQGHWTWS